MSDQSLPRDEYRALLGKRVRVTLNHEEKVITEGQLLGFGEGGDFEILEDDGFVHYCWPMLSIEEVPEPVIDMGYLSLPAGVQADIEQPLAEHRKDGSDG
jgi:hypothetical protein